MDLSVLYELFRDTFVVELMNYTYIPFDWKEHIYHISWNFQSIFGEWTSSGRERENDRARQSVFCTALNPFGQDTEEEPVVSFCTVLHKQYYERHWKRNQDAVYCTKLSRAQDQGFRFW